MLEYYVKALRVYLLVNMKIQIERTGARLSIEAWPEKKERLSLKRNPARVFPRLEFFSFVEIIGDGNFLESEMARESKR